MTSTDPAPAQAAGEALPAFLHRYLSAPLAPLALVLALGLAPATAGCATGGAGMAAALVAAKPVLETTCWASRMACDAVETVCGYVDGLPAPEPGAGGEAPAEDAGAPDAGPSFEPAPPPADSSEAGLVDAGAPDAGE